MYKISTENGDNKIAKFVPLTFLKDTTSIVEFYQECGEPVFVTRNGTPELVIMDTLSQNRKRNDLAGYHLKSFESQWTNFPSHRLSPERGINSMLIKKHSRRLLHERKSLIQWF